MSKELLAALEQHYLDRDLQDYLSAREAAQKAMRAQERVSRAAATSASHTLRSLTVRHSTRLLPCPSMPMCQPCLFCGLTGVLGMAHGGQHRLAASSGFPLSA